MIQAFFMQDTIKLIVTHVCDQEQSGIFIALLSDLGYYAFEEENNSLFAYIEENRFDENKLLLLSGLNGNYSFEKIIAQNWNAIWEAEFKPVIIDDYVAVRAAFHTPILNVKYELIITPKMSFGTAHHATTYLMIDQMQRVNMSGKQVFDFGTGTGILAILASKSGAENVVAIDNDDLSIENARENIMVNHCENIKVLQKEVLGGLGKFDVVLANINLHIILKNLEAIRELCSATATVLLSGFLSSDKNSIISQCEGEGFEIIRMLERDGWLCIQLQINDL